MRTVEFQADIGKDGKLRVEVPSGFRPGPVKGVVVFEEARGPMQPPYDTLEGIMTGKLSADMDVDAALKEMDDAWKRKLDLPAEE